MKKDPDTTYVGRILKKDAELGGLKRQWGI